MEKNPKLTLDDLQVESFAQEISADELTQIEAAGGDSYGPGAGATSSFNCYSICKVNQC